MDNQSNYNNGNNGYGGGGYGSGGPGNNGSNGNNNNNGNNGDNNNKNNKNGQMIMVFILVTLVALFIMSMVMNRYTSMSTSEISYSDFLQMVEDGKVESVEFDSYQINITPVSENKNPYLQEQTYYCGRLDDPDLLPLLKDKGITISRVIPDNTSTWIYNILSFLPERKTVRLPLLLLPLQVMSYLYQEVLKQRSLWKFCSDLPCDPGQHLQMDLQYFKLPASARTDLDTDGCFDEAYGRRRYGRWQDHAHGMHRHPRTFLQNQNLPERKTVRAVIPAMAAAMTSESRP